jgi:hypothetical protein
MSLSIKIGWVIVALLVVSVLPYLWNMPVSVEGH